MTVRQIVLFILFLLPVIVSTSVEAQPNPGLLVFTDYPSNSNYTVEAYDLDRDERIRLPVVDDESIGTLALINSSTLYVASCPIFGDGMFCQTYFSGIFSPDDLPVLKKMVSFWKLEYGSPHPSPDLRHVALIIDHKDHAGNYQGDVYLMNADGSGLRDLTADEDDNGYSLAWSPDSGKLAFACESEHSICITNVTGGQVQRIPLSEAVEVRDLMWSPDGKQLVVWNSQSDSGTQVYILNVDDATLFPLIDGTPNHFRYPVWSPDGNKIAFMVAKAEDNYSGEIYVINADGTGVVDISASLQGSENTPVWSPDSRSIAFFSIQHQKGTFLYIARDDGTDIRQLTPNSMFQVDDAGAPELFWLP